MISEDRGEQLVTAAVESAWTMPGPYALRAFLSWPGTVSRGCYMSGKQWLELDSGDFVSSRRGRIIVARIMLSRRVNVVGLLRIMN